MRFLSILFYVAFVPTLICVGFYIFFQLCLTSPDSVLATPPAIVGEANMLQERYVNRYHRSTPFEMQYRNQRDISSRQCDIVGSSPDRNAADDAFRKSAGGKVVEADGVPLVNTDDLKPIFRILHVVQVTNWLN